MSILTDNLDDSSTDSNNLKRKYVLSYFSAEKLMRTFRFDQTYIEYKTRLNLT